MNLIFDIYEKAGRVNTLATLQNAKANADLLGIKKIMIASTFGESLLQAIKIFDPSIYKLICVTHNFYFKENTPQTFPNALRDEFQAKGISFVQGTLALSGVNSAILRKFNYFDGITLFSKLLRVTMGDGVKVCIEMTLMGVDGGFIDMGEDVITIAGTGRGADTCCWIKASSSRFMEQVRVKAILTKPI